MALGWGARVDEKAVGEMKMHVGAFVGNRCCSALLGSAWVITDTVLISNVD